MLAFPALIFGQWTENFESNTDFPAEWAVLPTGWAIINNGDPNGWKIGKPNGSAQSGEYVAKIAFGSAAHDDYLITKAINVQAGVSDNISFYIRSRGSSTLLENYEILLSNTDRTSTAFSILLQQEQKAPNTWTKVSFDLSAYVGQTVYVAVHATDTNQWELYADTFVVSSNALATTEVTKAKDIVGVYPNPLTDVLNISKTDKIKSVSVTDLSGKLIKTIEKPSPAIHLGDLKQGIYFVTLNMKDGTQQTIKTIKK